MVCCGLYFDEVWVFLMQVQVAVRLEYYFLWLLHDFASHSFSKSVTEKNLEYIFVVFSLAFLYSKGITSNLWSYSVIFEINFSRIF